MMDHSLQKCPDCGSCGIWKDGLRKTQHGDVQRYVCRDCGFRFSDGDRKIVNRASEHRFQGQICVSAQRRAKNLAIVKPLREGPLREATADIKGKLVEYTWWLKNNGSPEGSIGTRLTLLKGIVRNGGDLLDPESVKAAIANGKKRKLGKDGHSVSWSVGYKAQAVWAYNLFVKKEGLIWSPPRYRQQDRKLPWIPLEKDIDSLIAACGHKLGTILLLLKETAMRIGEALRLQWIDVNPEVRSITVNNPEKNSRSRQFKVSANLIARIELLPKKDDRVFSSTRINVSGNFRRVRKNIARKLANPRLENIHFHTLRHWKATMEYHKTKDILHVRNLLGHRDLDSTLIYTQLVNFPEDNEWHVAHAVTLEEEDHLVKNGYDFVRFSKQHQVAIYRKRK